MIMSKERRKYDREYKQMVVELSLQRSDIPELAQELGIKPDLIYRWKREYRALNGHSFPGNGNLKQTPGEAEIARLKKELRETQIERDILKKAAPHAG